MADPTTRAAARLAAFIAIPIALLAGLGVFAAIGGFSSDDPPPPPPSAAAPAAATTPVPTQARPLTEREATVCRALLSQLPDNVDSLAQRPVTSDAEQNAAYGEPPIMLECGVPAAEYALTDTVWPLSGVCWHASQEPDGTAWTTLDREVPVRVSVPATYDPPGQRVTEFSAVIVETIRSAEEMPTGCRP